MPGVIVGRMKAAATLSPARSIALRYGDAGTTCVDVGVRQTV